MLSLSIICLPATNVQQDLQYLYQSSFYTYQLCCFGLWLCLFVVLFVWFGLVVFVLVWFGFVPSVYKGFFHAHTLLEFVACVFDVFPRHRRQLTENFCLMFSEVILTLGYTSCTLRT